MDRLDPELASHLDAVPAMDLSRDIPALREAMTKQQAPLLAAAPEVPGVVSEDVAVPGGQRVRLYRGADVAEPVPALVWIHGGGMCFGSIEGDDYMCRVWTAKLGCTVASVEYRLSPEHQYPAHVDDCYAALRWVHANVASTKVVVGGASAGGGLAAGTVLLARDRGEVAVAFQLLIFPMIDDRAVTPSSREIDHPKVWNVASNRHGWAAYLGDRAGGDDVPLYAAPARAAVEDLRGLPPAYIDVGELDPFRDEDIAYASRLLQAGVACELHVTPGVFHASESSVLGAASSRRIRGYRNDVMQRVLGSR